MFCELENRGLPSVSHGAAALISGIKTDVRLFEMSKQISLFFKLKYCVKCTYLAFLAEILMAKRANETFASSTIKPEFSIELIKLCNENLLGWIFLRVNPE